MYDYGDMSGFEPTTFIPLARVKTTGLHVQVNTSQTIQHSFLGLNFKYLTLQIYSLPVHILCFIRARLNHALLNRAWGCYTEHNACVILGYSPTYNQFCWLGPQAHCGPPHNQSCWVRSQEPLSGGSLTEIDFPVCCRSRHELLIKSSRRQVQ